MRFTGYHDQLLDEHGIRLVVRLDGVDVTRGCVFADDTAGSIGRYRRSNGRIVLDGYGNPIEDVSTGTVEFQFERLEDASG